MNRIVSNWRHESCMMDQSSLVLSPLRLGQFQTPICFAGWIAVDWRPDCTSVVGCQIIREQPHIEFFLLKNVAAQYILGCCKRRRE
jgi:hypothetical protein